MDRALLNPIVPYDQGSGRLGSEIDEVYSCHG